MITYHDHDGHDYCDDMSGDTYYKDHGDDHRDDDIPFPDVMSIDLAPGPNLNTFISGVSLRL